MADKVGSHTYGANYLDVRRWDSSLNPHCNITIGKFCSIADATQIITNGNHKYHRVSTFPFAELGWIENNESTGSAYGKGEVKIGNDVWICHGVKIINAVKIGDGAILAGHSVVTRDVEPYAIVSGNPAEFIGYRFDVETRMKLLKIKWWDWEEAKIREALPLILKDDKCVAFLAKYYIP